MLKHFLTRLKPVPTALSMKIPTAINMIDLNVETATSIVIALVIEIGIGSDATEETGTMM